MTEPTVASSTAGTSGNRPVCTLNPVSRSTSSDGMGGKMLSRAMSSATPTSPIESMMSVAQSTMGPGA